MLILYTTSSFVEVSRGCLIWNANRLIAVAPSVPPPPIDSKIQESHSQSTMVSNIPIELLVKILDGLDAFTLSSCKFVLPSTLVHHDPQTDATLGFKRSTDPSITQSSHRSCFSTKSSSVWLAWNRTPPAPSACPSAWMRSDRIVGTGRTSPGLARADGERRLGTSLTIEELLS